MRQFVSKSQEPGARSRLHGLTLVEVMVTLAIFIVLATMTLMAVREVVAQWTLGERRRVLYEKASGVLDLMADDIKQAVTHEGPGATEVRAKMIGDIDTASGRQRLMFVRSFEAGPERALVFNAGDGRINDTNFTPDNPGANKPKGPLNPNPDTDDYTGKKLGDFKALGGMAMVGYFLNVDPATHDRQLMRAIHAPVEGQMSAMMNTQAAEIVASDVLYLGFDYWAQNTDTWQEQALAGSKEIGPQKIWDSTRGLGGQLQKFSLHRGPESLNDPEDDVFPQMIKVAITVDSPMPRCVHTALLADILERDGQIAVESTRGFPDGDDFDSYLLIEDEWLHYSKKTEQVFFIDKRAQRGSHAVGHPEKANVRVGHTFHRTIYIPNWRSNTMTNQQYYERLREQQGNVRQEAGR